MSKWFIKIEGWMVDELGLKGNELLVFAYLYSWRGLEYPEPIKTVYEKLRISKKTFYNVVQKLHLLSVKNTPVWCKNCTRKVQKLHSDECKNCTILYIDNYIQTSTNGVNAPTPARRTRNIKKDETQTAEAMTLDTVVLTAWTQEYEKVFSTSYVPDYRNVTTDTSTIADAIKEKAKEFNVNTSDSEAMKNFAADMFAAMWNAADKWQRDNWTLHTIATQFNQLYNSIKNGKSTNRGGRSDDADFAKAMAKYIASGD